MPIFELNQGQSPFIISVPHDGAFIPERIKSQMNRQIHHTPDRDLLINEVFAFAEELNITKIKSNISRYVIDLNRPADNKPLYPGQSETGLCPIETFDEHAIYKNSQTPDQKEIQHRIKKYWLPYHQQLKQSIQTIKARHGFCILIDAHSIKAEVPKFFQGTLPDINIGTNSGESCKPEIEHLIRNKLSQQSSYSHIINGRFKGGFITRHYGNPTENIHAIQFEISQNTYLNKLKLNLSKTADELTAFLKNIIEDLIDLQCPTT